MDSSRRTLVTLTSTFALAAALTGCTADPSAPETSTPSGSQAEASTTEHDAGTSSPETAVGTEDEESTAGPLSQLLAIASSGDAAVAEETIRQEMIAACMTELGFEYVPFVSGEEEHPELSGGTAPVSVEWASEHGYGIVERLLERFEDPQADPGPFADPADPNHAIWAALSPTAQEAYQAAFLGSEIESEEGYWMLDPEDPGCVNAAVERHQATWDAVFTDGAFDGLMDEINALGEQASADPKIAETTAAWAECMAAAGFPNFLDRSAASDAVHAELEPYEASAEAPSAGVLADISAKERAIATADASCLEQHDIHAAWADALVRREHQLLDSHRAEVEALVAAIAEASSASEG